MTPLMLIDPKFVTLNALDTKESLLPLLCFYEHTIQQITYGSDFPEDVVLCNTIFIAVELDI